MVAATPSSLNSSSRSIPNSKKKKLFFLSFFSFFSIYTHSRSPNISKTTQFFFFFSIMSPLLFFCFFFGTRIQNYWNIKHLFNNLLFVILFYWFYFSWKTFSNNFNIGILISKNCRTISFSLLCFFGCFVIKP